MHDPGEMLKKIENLEKNLHGSNRPEVLFARAQLLQAETLGKLLYIFIDISKKLDRAIDLLSYPTAVNMEKPQDSIKMPQVEDLVVPGKTSGVSSHVGEGTEGQLPGSIVDAEFDPDDDRVDAEFVKTEDGGQDGPSSDTNENDKPSPDDDGLKEFS